MSSLRTAQSKFVVMVARLIDRATELGYEITFGDCFRDPRVFGAMGERRGYGNANSCHKLRLAIDMNLFIDGEFRTDTEAHRALGEWWERQGGSWGGRFDDANHYSLEWNGVR